MPAFELYSDCTQKVLTLPGPFIEEYMLEANHLQLKVYLYLTWAKTAGLPASLSVLTEKFNQTERDVLRALRYWEKKGLVCLAFDKEGNLTRVGLKEMPQKQAPAASLDKPSYTPAQVKAFKEDPAMEELFFIAEAYIGRPLAPGEVRSLMYFRDTLHLSVELIDYLLQYCIDHDKRNFKYMETVARNWAQEGIETPAQAKAKVNGFEVIASAAPAKKKQSSKATVPANNNRFNQFPQNQYDFDALEKSVISN